MLSSADVKQSVFLLFRPWSHTNRRQMIAITGGPFRSADDLGSASKETGTSFGCRIDPISALSFEEVMQKDEDIRNGILSTRGTKPCAKDMPFVSASWSELAPGRLKIHSRRMMLRQTAYEWAEFCADLPENKSRQFFVLELLDPENARLSP